MRLLAHVKMARQPMTKLPPLKSLRAFEAVSRHMSLKLAAEELCVTPTAVSHQIRSLEDHLGIKLFWRLTRSLALTNDGAIYAPLVREAFDKLDAATLALRDVEAEGSLTIGATPSFASNWLGPRLYRFRERYPSITVRMHSSNNIDFTRQKIDIAICHCQGDCSGLEATLLLDNFVTPVCKPDLAPCSKISSAAQARALLPHPLIHYEGKGFAEDDPSWVRWFEASGAPIPDPPASAIYTKEQVWLREAAAGHCIALVSLLIAAHEIENGGLVAPCKTLLKDKSYFVACPSQYLDRPKVNVFREGLIEEASSFLDSPIETTCSLPKIIIE